MAASAERPDCARLLVTLPRAAGNHLGDLGRSGCRGANVLPAHQYTTDPERGRVFLRIEFHQRGLDAARERSEADFARVVATALEMGWRISYTRGRKRVAILVSRYQHCLPDLLWRWRGAELEADTQVPQLVDRYLAGDIDVDAFISHRASLDDVNRGFELMHHQDGIRTVLGLV